MADAELILVTAGIIIDGDRILVCQRHRSDSYGLQWEFPGGKVRDGEDVKGSLQRELTEELAIEADVGEEVFRLRHRYPDRYVEVVFFPVRAYRGTVRNRVFEAIAWVRRQDLTTYDFLEADRELAKRIARGEIV
jgi:8-oxo-dGTP diphosphatase